MYRNIRIIILALLTNVCCFAQTDSVKFHRSFFIEPEILAGRIVPNYQDYPQTGPRETIDLSIGSSNADDKLWTRYFNHPDVGLIFSFTQLGNQIFGDEADVLAFISMNTSRRLKNTWYFKFGLGASFFTKHYDTINNPENVAIGNAVTWAFRMFVYRTLWVKNGMSLRLCGGYCHSSDGHTVLPNYGLNSAVLGLSLQFNTHHTNPDFVYLAEPPHHDTTTYFGQLYTSFGIHARGNPSGPINGPEYGVFVAGLSGGFVYNKHLKLRAGFTYRNYGQLIDYTLKPYTYWQASNVIFSIGCEFLVGRIGMDIEGGLNIYKPWYKQFYQTYEGKTTTAMYYLKTIFPVRLGLNYYFIDPYKNPRFNMFFGAHIDANFGQADFSDICLGYTVRL